MKVSTFLKTTALALVTASCLSLQADTDCSKCDCSYFPISDSDCVKCCFYEKGTVTSVSATSVTVAPTSRDTKQPVKKFEIKKSTKINGNLQNGTNATVYYHETAQEDVATRIDAADFSHGYLFPANLPGPPDTCAALALSGVQAPPIPADAMRIFFGNSEAFSTESRFIVLKTGTDESLVLQKTESGMSVSAKVRGPDGRVEAEIVDNDFFINSRNSFQIKKARTSSLVVNNDHGQPILDIEFLNPRVIKILGVFFGSNGEKVTIEESEMSFSAGGPGILTMSASCFGGGSSGVFVLNSGGVKVN
jgi:hypothetical protein